MAKLRRLTAALQPLNNFLMWKIQQQAEEERARRQATFQADLQRETAEAQAGLTRDTNVQQAGLAREGERARMGQEALTSRDPRRIKAMQAAGMFPPQLDVTPFLPSPEEMTSAAIGDVEKATTPTGIPINAEALLTSKGLDLPPNLLKLPSFLPSPRPMGEGPLEPGQQMVDPQEALGVQPVPRFGSNLPPALQAVEAAQQAKRRAFRQDMLEKPERVTRLTPQGGKESGLMTTEQAMGLGFQPTEPTDEGAAARAGRVATATEVGKLDPTVVRMEIDKEATLLKIRLDAEVMKTRTVDMVKRATDAAMHAAAVAPLVAQLEEATTLVNRGVSGTDLTTRFSNWLGGASGTNTEATIIENLRLAIGGRLAAMAGVAPVSNLEAQLFADAYAPSAGASEATTASRMENIKGLMLVTPRVLADLPPTASNQERIAYTMELTKVVQAAMRSGQDPAAALAAHQRGAPSITITPPTETPLPVDPNSIRIVR